MSCVESKNNLPETKVIKLNNSEETVTLSLSGKPCIDFQPDDRWQIKDDKSPAKIMQNSNELKNGSRRSRRLRSAKSNDSNSAPVNGETAESASDSENFNKDELEESVEAVERPSRRKRKDSESKNMADVSVNKKIKINDATLENNDKSKSPLDKKEEDSNSMDVDEKSNIDGNDIKLNNCTSDVKENVSKDVADEFNDKIIMPSLSPVASEYNNDSSKSTKDNMNETIELDESEIENESKDDDISEVKTNNGETPTFNKIKKTDDTISQESSEADVNGSDSKDDADIEIININDEIKGDDSESDSECQIINPEVLEAFETPTVTTDFSSTPVTDVHYTLTAGFPFYNSLKEKISNFKAGEFKPVKFPHTGTLLLGENEVIIESPSLLVPLLIKEADEFPKLDGENRKANGPSTTVVTARNMANKRNFFQSSVGQFLINLGMSRVQEFYQQDVRRTKLKKLKTVGGKDEELESCIDELETKIEDLKKANAAFNFRMHRCKFCSFKSESLTVMEGHYLIPHVTPRREYKCNFCPFYCRASDDIVTHYTTRHKKRAILDSYIPFHECIFCSFQSHLKNKVNAHMNRCRKHFIPAQNLSPPFDFEFPGVTTKPVTISDVIGHRRLLLSSAKNPRMPDGNDPNSVLARQKLASVLTKLGKGPYDLKNPNLMKQLMAQSQMAGPRLQLPPGLVITQPPRGQFTPVRAPVRFQGTRGVAPLRGVAPRAPFVTNLTSAASQQLASSGVSITPVAKNNATKPTPGSKNVTLTPIGTVTNRTVSQKPGPPQPMALFTNVAGSTKGMIGQPQPRLPTNMQLRPLRPAPPYQRLSTPPSQVVKGAAGNTFVVCEICDSYIKDLEELRTHMNWVHKVKIHPKMLVSRPPLNCQKCHWRFFTDQGLERHLLGAHGLVTTNMQEMANKNQDGGRCIICGAVFTYKLVSHMTQVHKVTLKPAHLSYKCTVCTATFTLYRLFESHVYNVHSGSSKKGLAEDLPLDPPKKTHFVEKGPRKCKDCGYITENMQDHLIKTHLKNCAVQLCKIEKCEKCLNSSDEMLIITMSDFGIEDSDESGEDDSEGSSEESDDENSKPASSKTRDPDKKSEDKDEKKV